MGSKPFHLPPVMQLSRVAVTPRKQRGQSKLLGHVPGWESQLSADYRLFEQCLIWCLQPRHLSPLIGAQERNGAIHPLLKGMAFHGLPSPPDLSHPLGQRWIAKIRLVQ